MNTASQPATDPPHQAEGEDGAPDGFVSYSHRHAEFVRKVVDAARARDRHLWMDGDDLPPGAPWRAELGTALEASAAVVLFVSPEWLESVECRREYDRALELGKRLVPVQISDVPAVPAGIDAVQRIMAVDGADPQQVATKIITAIEADHDRVREHRRWLVDALHWEADGRDRSGLLRGKELEAAERWLARGGVNPTPTPLQVALVTASRQAERRRLRTTIAVSLVAVLLTAALAVTALIQWAEAVQQRNQAESRALAAAAQTQLDVDSERSLLLAGAAYRMAPTSQSVSALRSALQRSWVRVTVATAHRAAVSGVAWAPDGSTVITAARDGTLAAWDAATGTPTGRLDLGPGAVERLVAARGEPIGVALTEDGAAVLWALDPGTGALVERAVLADSGIAAIAISDDGRTIAGARGSGPVAVWNASGEPQPGLGWDTRGARSVALSADGRALLVGTDGGTRAGLLAGGSAVTLSTEASSTVQLASDGSVGLGAADSGAATVGRVADGSRLLELPPAYQAALDPTGRHAAVARIDGRVELLTVDKPAEPLLERGTLASYLGFSADGSSLLVARLDGTITAWRTTDGTLIAELRAGTASTQEVAASPDGLRLVSGHGDGAVRIWALPERPLLPVIADQRYPVATSSIALSPDGDTVLTADRGGLARTWDARSGREKATGSGCTVPPLGPGCLAAAVLSTNVAQLNRAVYSPDGRLVATASARGRVIVWGAATAEELARAPDVGSPVTDVAFSGDSQQLVTADGVGTARIIEAGTGRVRAELAAGARQVYTATFAAGSDALLTAGEGGLVRRWELNSAQPTSRELTDLGDTVFDLAVEPRGRYAAAATASGIAILDPTTGQRVRQLFGHVGFVNGVAFAAAGSLLVSGGLDGTVRVWDTNTWDQVASFAVPGGDVSGVDADSSGRRLAAASRGGNAFVFNCEVCAGPEDLIRLADRRATRELTAEERSTYGLP